MLTIRNRKAVSSESTLEVIRRCRKYCRRESLQLQRSSTDFYKQAAKTSTAIIWNQQESVDFNKCWHLVRTRRSAFLSFSCSICDHVESQVRNTEGKQGDCLEGRPPGTLRIPAFARPCFQCIEEMEPRSGLEPETCRLRIDCSTN